MKFSYCTLFDVNYIDKGMVLIESFLQHNKSSVFYVLAMDELAFQILQKEKYERVVIVNLTEFENDKLKRAKENRSRGEYCWTCASSFIRYVLTSFNEECCTYVDADIKFYRDPDSLVQEMIDHDKSVQIIEHRFKNSFSNRYQQKMSGKYCVEFNTFLNNPASMSVLENWCNDTIEGCRYSFDGHSLGDQMYLNDWCEKYDCVNVLSNAGAGVAPWNINRYRYSANQDGYPMVCYDKSKNSIPLFFYHFHDLKYLSEDTVCIGVYTRYWNVDDTLVSEVYGDYLASINTKKKYLKDKYGVCPLIKGNAVGITDQRSLFDRFKGLFNGNAFVNILFRIVAHIKIVAFGHKDIMKKI